jgi:hypothetical protein
MLNVPFFGDVASALTGFWTWSEACLCLSNGAVTLGRALDKQPAYRNGHMPIWPLVDIYLAPLKVCVFEGFFDK